MDNEVKRQEKLREDAISQSGDAILEYLSRLGVSTIFGVPGGAIEPFYNAIARRYRDKKDIRHVLTRHEAGAAFMADGYSRRSNTLGVCCTTSGPGATNLLTGIACAYSDQVPLLAITAQSALSTFGRDALQESSSDAVDTVAMFEPCTRYNSLVSHQDQLMQKLYKAISYAYGPTPGPVHLSIPLDIMRAPFQPDWSGMFLPVLPQTSRILPDESLLNAAIDAIRGAKSGAFVLGAEAAGAMGILIPLAEKLNWPIITTPIAKGLIPTEHHLCAGVIGLAGHQSAEKALHYTNAELIVCVGVRFDEVSTNSWDSDTLLSSRIVAISPTLSNLASLTHVQIKLFGTPKLVLQEIQEKLQTKPQQIFTRLPQKQEIVYDDGSIDQAHNAPVKPQALMQYVSRAVPPGTQAVFDAGNSFLFAIHYWVIPELLSRSNNFSVEMGFSSMGWSVGAAIGQAFADPSSPVVCMIGDGGMLMNGNDITVAQQHQLNVVFFILNDATLGTVKHGQRMSGAERIATTLPDINFAAMAEAMGIRAKRIKNFGDLQGLDFNKLFESPGPILLDVIIDREEQPPLKSRLKALGTWQAKPNSNTAAHQSASKYSFTNSWESAKTRLKFIEQCHDHVTTQMLDEAFTLRPIKSCWEIGAGAGSIANWLTQRVGKQGHVVASDINTDVLEQCRLPAVEIHRQDVTKVMPNGPFDLIHTRAMLIHIPERSRVLRDMYQRLAPGGIMLIEEPDFVTCNVLNEVGDDAKKLYREVISEIIDFQQQQGMDYFYGEAIHGELIQSGMIIKRVHGVSRIVAGGSEEAEFFRLTYKQVMEPVTRKSAITSETYTAFLRLFTKTDFGFRTHMMMSYLAQKHEINP